MFQKARQFIIWFDSLLSRLWNDALWHMDIFIHGDFTYWGFIKNNVHLFLALGLFGALTGYLNAFIEREVPFNAYAGKLGVNQTPLSVFHAALSGQNPLNTPFPPADLIFGITCALILFVLIAFTALWAAIEYRETEVHHSSEVSLLMRISFVTLFGSLILVFLSYIIRNYGLLVQALLELFSGFAAIYLIAFVLKRAKNPWPWFVAFILPGAIVYLFRIYVPVVSIFFFSVGVLSLVIILLMLPFLLIKKAVGRVKEKHID